MPIYSFDINDTETTVQKPVVENVVRNLLAWTGMDEVRLEFDSDEIQEQFQPESTVGTKKPLSFGSDVKVTLEVEETRNPLSRIERGSGLDFEYALFHDDEIGIKASPSLVQYDTTVTLRVRAPSKAAARKWYNLVQRSIDKGADQFVTQAEFYYNIPPGVLNIIADCWRTKYQGVIEPEPLVSYLKRNFSNAVSVLANTTGTHSNYISRNTVKRIVGWFGDAGPEVRKSDNSVNYEASISYTFTYHVPESMTIAFPSIIDGLYIPEKWWPKHLVPGWSDETNVVKSVHVNSQDQIVDATRLDLVLLPLFIPPIDNAVPVLPNPAAAPVALAVINFETGREPFPKPAPLINLESITNLDFSPEMLDYISDSYADDPTGSESIFKTNFYIGSMAVDQSKIAIDPEGNIWYNGNIDFRHPHKAVPVVETNLGELSNEAYGKLRQSPAFVQQFTEQFLPEVAAKFPVDPTAEIVPAGLLTSIVDASVEASTNTTQRANKVRAPITVVNGTILSYRGD